MSDKKINVGYMLIPMDLTDEQEHIYIKMYKKCNFNTMEVAYTVEQLVNDSNKCFELTTMNVRTILKNLMKKGYITELQKGRKGSPTVYRINKIKELNQQQSNNNLTTNQQLKPSNNEGSEGVANSNLTTNQQQSNNPINEKEKENNIYTNEDYEDIWKLYPLKKGKSSYLKKIPKILKEHSKEEIIRCIDRYVKYVDSVRKKTFNQSYMQGSTFFNSGYIDYLDENYEEPTNNLNKKQKFDATKYYD